MNGYEEIIKRIAEKTEELRKKTFSPEYNEGYAFATNSYNEDVKVYVEKYESNGHEVIVKDIAFDIVGQRLNLYRTLLVRKGFKI